MEEKKKPGRKPATSQEQPVAQQHKLSYEELTNVANQLSMQNRQLRQQIQQINMSNIFQRLNYLFKVVENGHMFSEDFLNSVTAEIEETLKIPKEEENTEVGPEEEGEE